MERRYLGRTGLAVSQLCLGTMPLGGDADEATSAAILARARDAGIDLLDCTDVYADAPTGDGPERGNDLARLRFAVSGRLRGVTAA